VGNIAQHYNRREVIMEEPLKAVYTGDSSKYHIFQIVEDEKLVVGSLYIRKTENLPETVEVDLLTPNNDNFLWSLNVKTLRERARNGSKAKRKLDIILQQREEK
jgi:hypothetical protein